MIDLRITLLLKSQTRAPSPYLKIRVSFSRSQNSHDSIAVRNMDSHLAFYEPSHIHAIFSSNSKGTATRVFNMISFKTLILSQILPCAIVRKQSGAACFFQRTKLSKYDNHLYIKSNPVLNYGHNVHAAYLVTFLFKKFWSSLKYLKF